MKPHLFIFTPGIWQGTGKISFSMAEDELPFNMSWSVHPVEHGQLKFSQIVEVENFDEPLHNHFTMSEIKDSNFMIQLENTIVGKVEGNGVYDEKIIAWEFRKADQGFEGYEIYERQPDSSYKMKAEFMGGEDIRTFVEGVIKLVK